jgi:A/G-specific adenine glycosylase
MELSSLLLWSEGQFSSLPWRQNRSLYRTLVSEIMLQQTTVATVKNHFERFLIRFPTLETLAKASEDELTVAWKGLGYYRRARNLKKIAETITYDHQGEFPNDLKILNKIPGIGPYTSNALLAIGMDERALAVDANLERVIARLFNINSEKGLKLQREIMERFMRGQIFNEKISFRALNEALMDLGRTYCQARKVNCVLCPLKSECASFKIGKPLLLPLTKDAQPNKSIEHELHLIRVFVFKKQKILVYQKSNKEWLSGQFEVPTFILSTTDKNLKQYPRIKTKLRPQFSFKTGITKYRIKNDVVLLNEEEFKELKFPIKSEWRSISMENSNFSTATIKALKKIDFKTSP